MGVIVFVLSVSFQNLFLGDMAPYISGGDGGFGPLTQAIRFLSFGAILFVAFYSYKTIGWKCLPLGTQAPDLNGRWDGYVSNSEIVDEEDVNFEDFVDDNDSNGSNDDGDDNDGRTDDNRGDDSGASDEDAGDSDTRSSSGDDDGESNDDDSGSGESSLAERDGWHGAYIDVEQNWNEMQISYDRKDRDQPSESKMSKVSNPRGRPKLKYVFENREGCRYHGSAELRYVRRSGDDYLRGTFFVDESPHHDGFNGHAVFQRQSNSRLKGVWRRICSLFGRI